MSEMPGGPKINNDVLSCFLKSGVTVGDVTEQVGATLSTVSRQRYLIHRDSSGSRCLRPTPLAVPEAMR